METSVDHCQIVQRLEISEMHILEIDGLIWIILITNYSFQGVLKVNFINFYIKSLIFHYVESISVMIVFFTFRYKSI